MVDAPAGWGQGPAIQSMALPFSELHSLPPTPAAWVTGGPVSPRNAIVVGSWWMMREIELSNVKAAHVTFIDGHPLAAEILLPASKSDQAALGVRRTHCCVCSAAAFRPDCPVHALLDQFILLRRRHPGRFAGRTPDATLPLFPDEGGRPTQKRAVVDTLKRAAELLKVPLISADGRTRISGHSLRPTGAQGLAHLGLDLWSIQLLGRWGSQAVQLYVRDASVALAAAKARHAMMSWNLSRMTDELRAVTLEDKAELTEDKLRQLITEWAPEALRAERSSILAELQAHLIAEDAADSPSSDSSATSSETEAACKRVDLEVRAAPIPTIPREVSSRKDAKRHLVDAGPPEVLDPARWVAVCGWRFGMAGRAESPDASHPLCALCLRRAPAWGVRGA